MKHPSEEQIALYARHDVPFFQRLSIGGHLRACGRCRTAVDSYRQAHVQLKDEFARMPAGLEWDRLAAEMTGNIRVGLAAGECVSQNVKVASRGIPMWKPVMAIAAMLAVVMGGMWLNFPAAQRQSLAQGLQRIWSHEDRTAPPMTAADAGVYLESTGTGIEVKDNGGTLTMMHPDARPSVISVSTQGSVRARYINADTGQVTITNVYAW